MKPLHALVCLTLVVIAGIAAILAATIHPVLCGFILFFILFFLFFLLTSREERWQLFARLVMAFGVPGHPDPTMDSEAFRSSEFHRNIRNL